MLVIKSNVWVYKPCEHCTFVTLTLRSRSLNTDWSQYWAESLGGEMGFAGLLFSKRPLGCDSCTTVIQLDLTLHGPKIRVCLVQRLLGWMFSASWLHNQNLLGLNAGNLTVSRS